MGTKTIGLDEEAYERLRAEKREDESFSDVVKRVTAEIHTDWRRGFGKYAGADGERLERVARESRDRRGRGFAGRADAVVEALRGESVEGVDPGGDSAESEDAEGENENAESEDVVSEDGERTGGESQEYTDA